MGRKLTSKRQRPGKRERRVSVRSKVRGEPEYRKLARVIIEYAAAREEAAAAAQHRQTTAEPGTQPEEVA